MDHFDLLLFQSKDCTVKIKKETRLNFITKSIKIKCKGIQVNWNKFYFQLLDKGRKSIHNLTSEKLFASILDKLNGGI